MGNDGAMVWGERGQSQHGQETGREGEGGWRLPVAEDMGSRSTARGPPWRPWELRVGGGVSAGGSEEDRSQPGRSRKPGSPCTLPEGDAKGLSQDSEDRGMWAGDAAPCGGVGIGRQRRAGEARAKPRRRRARLQRDT